MAKSHSKRDANPASGWQIADAHRDTAKNLMHSGRFPADTYRDLPPHPQEISRGLVDLKTGTRLDFPPHPQKI